MQLSSVVDYSEHEWVNTFCHPPTEHLWLHLCSSTSAVHVNLWNDASAWGSMLAQSSWIIIMTIFKFPVQHSIPSISSFTVYLSIKPSNINAASIKQFRMKMSMQHLFICWISLILSRGVWISYRPRTYQGEKRVRRVRSACVLKIPMLAQRSLLLSPRGVPEMRARAWMGQ